MSVKYFRRAYTTFATHVYDVPPRMLAFLLLIALSLLPLGLDIGKLGILTTANIIAILAISWDLLVGRTGQISLGHALFFGTGMYAAALLLKYFGWPVWITIPISLLICTGIAVIVGVPCLRLKGPYLALVTMAFPLAVTGFLLYYYNVFGGSSGLRMSRIFTSSMVGFSGIYTAQYYLSLSLMAISAVILYKIANSKRGLVFVSILDDELASKACGINVTKNKLMAFAISGLFGSLAGCISAAFNGSANPQYFNITYSILPLIVTILGGIGTIYGPLIGTYIYYLLNNYVFTQLIPLNKDLSLLIFILIVIIFVIKWPRGIARFVVDKLADLQEPREIEETEKKNVKRFRPWRNAFASFIRRLRKKK